MINTLPPEVLVQVLDTLPVRIFWKDRDSRFLGCNRQFALDAGVCDPCEFIGLSDYSFYPPEQAAAFRDGDLDVIMSGEPKLGVIEKLTRPAGTIWLETNKWPLRGTDGEIIGVVGMYQDITDRMIEDEENCRALLGAVAVAFGLNAGAVALAPELTPV
jgi:PAS domain S-box-containing protein